MSREEAQRWAVWLVLVLGVLLAYSKPGASRR